MSALFVSPVGNLSLSVKRHPALLGMMERCMRSNLRIGIVFFGGGDQRVALVCCADVATFVY